MTNDYLCFKSVDKVINLYKDGRYDIHGECMLFPSKDQRDWNKWLKEQKPKVPKTWSEIENYTDVGVRIHEIEHKSYTVNNTPIEKSVLALLKIYQLIEVGYGGNVTKKEWKNDEFKFIIAKDASIDVFNISSVCHCAATPIAFHIREQAEEFLKYPENVQLLKDYFMIND